MADNTTFTPNSVNSQPINGGSDIINKFNLNGASGNNSTTQFGGSLNINQTLQTSTIDTSIQMGNLAGYGQGQGAAASSDPNAPFIGGGLGVPQQGSAASAAQNNPKKAIDSYNNNQQAAYKNSHQATDKEILDLEKQTNLVNEDGTSPGLTAIYLFFRQCHLNKNARFLLLQMLVKGFDYDVMTANLSPTQNQVIIDDAFKKRFVLMGKDANLIPYLKKTPAWAKGCFKSAGAWGATAASGTAQPSSPITGPEKHAPSLVEKILESIHPGTTAALESFCNKIRTHSWLAAPKGSFSSLSRLVHGIEASIAAFQKMITDIYQGCIAIVKQIYAYINGIMAQIQKKIISIINQIIPIDLLCLILDTLQVILNDINFFTSLFQMAGPWLNYLNSFQQYLNITSSFVQNPLGTIQSFLPPQVNNIITMVNQMANDPNGFISDKMTNFQYGYVLQALQGNMLGALASKYGSSYAASQSPLGNILSKGTAIYTHFGGQFPPNFGPIGANSYVAENGTEIDVNSNPVVLKTVNTSIISDVNPLATATANLGSNIGAIAGQTVTNLGNDACNFSKAFGDIGGGLAGIPSDVGNATKAVGTTIGNIFTGKTQ